MLADFDPKFPQYSLRFSFTKVSRDTAVSNPPRSASQSSKTPYLRIGFQLSPASVVRPYRGKVIRGVFPLARRSQAFDPELDLADWLTAGNHQPAPPF